MGKLIVIDGLDGCGKATQVDAIYKILIDREIKVIKTSFPDYKSLSSGPIRMYLDGKLGSDPKAINPYTCSLFYAVDRAIKFETELKQYYNNGYIILADRYLSANIIHQGAKCNSIEEKQEIFKWIYDIETNKVGIPVEDITLALTLPIETSQRLMSGRYNGDETKKDIHEADLGYLNLCREALEVACDYLPKLGYNWVKVDCSDSNGDIRTRESITKQLMKYIDKILEG